MVQVVPAPRSLARFAWLSIAAALATIALKTAAFGVNIVVAGWRLVRHSVGGLMDTALPAGDHAAIEAVLQGYRQAQGIQFHALRTREAGARRFVSVHVLVPGSWTVQAGHDLLERLEPDLRTALGGCQVFTHLEPVEDPASWADGGDHPEGSPPT